MTDELIEICLIKGDGIGVDVIDATLAIIEVACERVGADKLIYRELLAGAGYYKKTGLDIEPGGEATAGQANAILLGAIGLPEVPHADGTEISPHLRLRDIYGLYAGVRPVKAYPNAPQRLADPRAATIDMVILRESTEGLFYSAAVHNRSIVIDDSKVRETLRITRDTSEKLHRFGFNLATKRKVAGRAGKLTCVDKANVFTSMAFFRKIYDEIAVEFPEIEKDYNYVDAQALDFIRRPWEFDVLVTENMFGDILSDLAGGLVGGMGMAPCAEIGDSTGLYQPAHGSAPDIMGLDRASPLAAILSGVLMLDYLAEKRQLEKLSQAAALIENSVQSAFEQNRIRPFEVGGDMGTQAITDELILLILDPWLAIYDQWTLNENITDLKVKSKKETHRLAVVVELTIKPENFGQFLARVVIQASNSLTREALCFHFDVCVDSDQNQILLYEIYADKVAFEFHLTSEHFLRFDADTADWISDEKLKFYRRAAIDTVE